MNVDRSSVSPRGERMMGLLRKAWGAVVQIWVCLITTASWLLGRTRKDHTHPAPPPSSQWRVDAGGRDTEWENWDTMEEFSVKVVPDGSHGDQEESEDLFKDMQPVLKKTKKIQVKTTARHETRPEAVNNKMFAVDTIYPPESTELESWSEEGVHGWEEEEEVDLLQTKESLRAQRRAERERRKAEMEQLRQQKAHHHSGHLSLGTRVP